MIEYRFDDRLRCHVVSIAYDFRTHSGVLYLREGDCCNMGGCIDLFEEIDPKVKIIRTYSGHKADTLYLKQRSKWKAFLPEIIPSASAEPPRQRP